jgi:spermidine synthase
VEIKRQARIDVLLDEAKEAFNRGEYARAAAEYSEILKLDDEHVMTWLNLGNAYISMKRYADAEAAYGRSVEINPYYIYGYIALAKLHLATGQAAKAESVLREVIAWNPGDAETRVYAGLAFSLQKAHDKAKAEFEKALALDSEFAPPHYYLGVYALQSNPGQARRHLEKFLRLAETPPGDENLVLNAQKMLKSL